MSGRNEAEAGTVRTLDSAPVTTLLRRLWRHRDLLRELTARDLSEAYAGSMLSRLWAVLHPLLLIGVYVFVFGYVFTARLGADLPAEPDFAVFILAGLGLWLSIQAALAKSASALVGSANLVKQVVFPIELLPVRSVLAAQLPFLVSTVVVVLYSGLRFGMVSPLLPLVIYVAFWTLVLLVGLALILAPLTVFLRDTRDVVQVVSSFGVFLLPVIYLPGSLPPWFETLLHLNPFSYPVWCMQDALFFQGFEHPFAWLVLPVLALLALWAGLRFFERTRHNLGDVL
ncbi:MAG: ABC transporter [Mesorhizobium amorphae]|nr:MAG: ABC transporter [Mesorhizobium amorphae]